MFNNNSQSLLDKIIEKKSSFCFSEDEYYLLQLRLATPELKEVRSHFNALEVDQQIVLMEDAVNKLDREKYLNERYKDARKFAKLLCIHVLKGSLIVVPFMSIKIYGLYHPVTGYGIIDGTY